jgi:hypothetical protein
VSEQQNLSSTEGWSPQSLRFSFPKTVGTNALLGVRTELLQLLDFSGDFIQSVIEQTADKTDLVRFQPKTVGTNALLGVRTEMLQLLDFSGDVIQSVIEQTADKMNLVRFQIFMANHVEF